MRTMAPCVRVVRGRGGNQSRVYQVGPTRFAIRHTRRLKPIQMAGPVGLKMKAVVSLRPALAFMRIGLKMAATVTRT